MAKFKSVKKNFLELEININIDSVTVFFKGKSVERDPSEFITPVLSEAMETCEKENLKLVMDFLDLEFMNSSTITPITKFIELAKEKGVSVQLIYKKSVKWQELNFSALQIFETNDKQIEIKGI